MPSTSSTRRFRRATTVRSRATSPRNPRVRVLPYKPGSASAKLLSEHLAAPRVKTDGTSKFRSRPTDAVVNWGSSQLPTNLSEAMVLNSPSAVALSSNKLSALTTLRDAGISCLTFTTDTAQVRSWLQEGHVVFARTLLNSHSGRGIVQIEGADATIPSAPLYTLYKKKKHEYRAHVLPDGSVVVRQKRRKVDAENVDWRVRNLAGGFVFTHEISFMPPDLQELARVAVRTLGLDFGALDILYNEQDKRCYVIECNSAPGLGGSTIQMYVDAIRRRLDAWNM